MVYISKGIMKKSLGVSNMQVVHNGQTYSLTEKEAELWNRGRLGFAHTKNHIEEQMVTHLEELGVAELEREEQKVSKYCILTRCICCETVKKHVPLSLGKEEKRLFTWICKSGLRLSMAELTYLMEYDVRPLEVYLGENNRHNLVKRIYLQSGIFDNLLETQMEHARKRDDTVRLIEQLLKKKHIMLM